MRFMSDRLLHCHVAYGRRRRAQLVLVRISQTKSLKEKVLVKHWESKNNVYKNKNNKKQGNAWFLRPGRGRDMFALAPAGG